MFFMMASTLVAMWIKLSDFYRSGERVLLVVGACITLVALWLVIEAGLALLRYRSQGSVESLDVPIPER
jgi:hypothetical protein